MILKFINKINGKLKFLCRKNRYLAITLCRMLCNALSQIHVDYARAVWYSNLNEKTKKKIQIMQNKSIHFCLKLDKRHHTSEKEFRLINWSPTSKRVDQRINAITSNFVNNNCLYYLNEIFEFDPYRRIDTRNKFSKFKNSFRKTNIQKKKKFLYWSLCMEQLGWLNQKSK